MVDAGCQYSIAPCHKLYISLQGSNFMPRIECTDRVYDLIAHAGLAERIEKEVFLESEFVPDTEQEYSVNALRDLGRYTKHFLKLPAKETQGFKSVNEFHIGLGAYIIGEYPYDPSYKWRASGNKTYVSSVFDDDLLITQTQTDSKKIFVADTERIMCVGSWYWPLFLGMSLMYFRKIHPDIQLNSFFTEHFKKCNHVFERLEQESKELDEAIAGCGDDNDEGAVSIQIENPGMGKETLHYLEELFLHGLKEPESTPVATIPFAGDNEIFYPFFFDNCLHFGIEAGNGDKPLIEVRAPQTIRNVQEYVTFTPADAEQLLLSIFDQYAPIRSEVEEVLDYFVWGVDMDREFKK